LTVRVRFRVRVSFMVRVRVRGKGGHCRRNRGERIGAMRMRSAVEAGVHRQPRWNTLNVIKATGTAESNMQHT